MLKIFLSLFFVPLNALATWEQYYDEPWPALHYTGVTVLYQTEADCEKAA